MKRRKLLRSGKNTSAIGLGCMNFCGFYGPSDEKQAHNTLAAAQDLGIDLLSHDSYTFFHKLGSLLHTGPTLTNVNDFRAVLVI